MFQGTELPRSFRHVRSLTAVNRRASLGVLSLGSMALLAVAASVGYTKVPPAAPKATPMPSTAQAFLRKNCLACHSKTNPSGKLDLTTAFLPDNRSNFQLWVKVIDRVAAGEMPPKTARQPAPAARKSFLAALTQPLLAADDARVRREGRSTWRRMNRYEYENTLRDVLDAPWLQIREMLPEDGLQARFNKVGDALDVSHVQMSRYLAAAGYALREVLATPAVRPETTTRRYYAREQRSFGPRGDQAPERATFYLMGDAWDPAVGERPTGPRPMGMQRQRRPAITVGAADPVKRELEAVGMVASSYEPLTPRFDQFRAPVAGRYKLRMKARSFWAHPQNANRWWTPSMKELSVGRTQEPVTLYSALPQGVTSILRKLGTLDYGPQAAVGEMEVWLLKGEAIMPDPARLFRSRPPNWHNPLATPEGQPGVAFHWLEVEGPLFDEWPTRPQRLLAGGLPLKPPAPAADTSDSSGNFEFRAPPPDTTPRPVEIVSSDPDRDGERLVRSFMQRALRRPVQDAEIQPFVKLFRTARDAGTSFTEALITAYTGVLCSPAFITLEERPGPLDDHALASRLSYFLWNSEPDAALRSLADRGALRDPQELARQTDRMLGDPKAQRFVEGFLDYWLDLRKTGNTNPDETLYPDYYLDDLLVESSIDESRAFFTELIRGDLPARNVVASDFVTINSHLANLYQIPGVQGSAMRRVALPKDSVRGGLLTQASVLKVTANGATTSPVIRGAWITERILGQPVPPPPPSVPAVEPDIRGATTIREQLAKHRIQPECASCHAKIDPPGFALENFDVFGGWRERYRALGDGPRVPGFGKNGQPFVFHAAQTVDSSGELPDGNRFKDVRELKQLLLRDERQIARNLVRQLVTYSTGAPVGFGDRPKVEAILDHARTGGYGVKSLIHGIIASELFRNK
jgi:hypothetical protein